MNPSMMQKVPAYIQKELETIGRFVRPLIKKSSTFTMISFPMILFSVFSFLILVFNGAVTKENTYYLLAVALIAAIGAALLKESRVLRKEIQKISSNYMVERIAKSKWVSEKKKNDFIHLIKHQPIFSFNTFLTFLEEEKKEEIID